MPSPQIKVIRVRNLSSSGGGGTPGGFDTQVQFNDGGAFGGDPRFIFNKAGGNFKTTGGVTWEIKASGSGFGQQNIAYLELGNPDVSVGSSVTIEFVADDGVFDINFNGSGTSSNPDTFIFSGNGVYSVLFKNTDVIVDGGDVQVNNKFTLASPGVPNAANAAGVAGRISWDTNFIYVCVATNTWKRAALSTW